MEARILGRTNLKVGVIGFGGIPIQRLQSEEAIQLIHTAKKQGINFIDTARGYGDSEKLIGLGIGKDREHWIVATKSMARGYDDMKRDIETSLKNLNCGCIDLYQFHLVKTKEQYNTIMGANGAYKALKEAQEAGLINEIGITSHNLEILQMAVETDYFSTIQFPYNIVENQGEELFERARKRNIGVIVMKPLAGGAIPNSRLALKFIVENPNITVIIPGMDKVEQVIENSEAGRNIVPLTTEEKEILDSVKKQLGSRFCRRCGYCLPCSKGIDIPTQFILEGYYTRYELQDWAIERYNGLPHKASECIQCGLCEERCPYELPIREMLKEVVHSFEGK